MYRFYYHLPEKVLVKDFNDKSAGLSFASTLSSERPLYFRYEVVTK